MTAPRKGGFAVMGVAFALALAACDRGPAGAGGTPLDIQVAHPAGVVLQIDSVSIGGDTTLVKARVLNGRDRDIELNAGRENTYLLTSSGKKILLTPPTANPKLTIPAGQSIEADLVFAGAGLVRSGLRRGHDCPSGAGRASANTGRSSKSRIGSMMALAITAALVPATFSWSAAPAINGASCGSEFDRRYNPSNTGNIRGNSRFTLAEGLTLFVDPSFQYVKANGGGVVTAEEGSATLTGTRPAGRRGCGGCGGSPPKACRAISPMPPSAPRMPDASTGIRNVFWFGECAKAVSASTYFCATK